MSIAGRTKVLSIVGAGRSGTTILASVLGENPGVLAAGEIRWLWQHGVIEGRPCGCALPPLRCPVWSIPLQRLLTPGPDGEAARSPELSAILTSQQEVTSLKNRRRVIRSVDARTENWPALEHLRAVTAQICASLVQATGSTVIVDTSKRAQEAAVFASIASIDHYVLHVVRDPRAVAYSWRRSKPAGPGAADQTMGTRGLLSSVKRWTENSVGAELLRRRLPPERWLFLRYEDFAAEPESTVARVTDHLGIGARTPFADDRSITLHRNHIVAGNPSRFRIGPVTIEADTEWRQGMTQRDQVAVVALALPLLLRYGYPVRSSGLPRAGIGRGAL